MQENLLQIVHELRPLLEKDPLLFNSRKRTLNPRILGGRLREVRLYKICIVQKVRLASDHLATHSVTSRKQRS